MNNDLKHKLLNMAAEDERVRADLVKRGELFDGYHPEMERVHNANAKVLSEFIKQYGWPSPDKVGKDATKAAWLIVQHAIGKPTFQKNCLALLKIEAENGRIAPKRVATLEDRINVFEGKPQTYGTQFDWDENAELSPHPIKHPDQVDALRHSVGLPPLDEHIKNMRAKAKAEGDTAPTDLNQRRQEIHQWAKKTGWRK